MAKQIISRNIRSMADPAQVRTVLIAYPRIYFACHTRHVHDAGTGVVLSRHQASILSHLDDVEPTSLTELAAHMGVTASTMSLAVRRLERHGLVVRARGSSDGRVVELRLSEAGVRIRDSQSVLDADRVAGLLDQLTETDRAVALRGLELLADAGAAYMRQAAGGRRAG